MKLLVAALAALVLTTQFAVAEDASSGLMADFGGKPGLVKVVDDLMINLLAEPKTKESFINTDQKRIKTMLVDQFCEVMGGGCKYTGKTMAQSHSGLDIKRGEFNSLVESLRSAMSKNNVPMRAQNKLLALLAPMHRDIIGK